MKKAWAKRNVGEEIKQLDQHHGIITPRSIVKRIKGPD
jgi:hypothetical protein